MPAASDWTAWTVAEGESPVCWDGGRQLAFLVPRPEGADLVTCRWDGADARVLALCPKEGQIGRSPDGRLLAVGGSLLVPTALGGPADLAPLLGLEPGATAVAVALSAEPSRILALDRDGRAFLAMGEGNGLIAGGPFRAIGISDRGDRFLLHGESAVEVRAVGEAAPVFTEEADRAALSGCGRRLALAVGAELRRVDLVTSAVSTLALPWTPDSLAVGEWGQRVLVGHEGEVLSVTWAGDVLRPVAHGAEGWRASPDGDAIVWSSGGQVRIAAFGLGVPPEVILPRFSRPRGIPSFPQLIRDLVPLAHAIAREGAGEPSAEATDSAWRVARHPAAPFTVGVPPGWDVSEAGEVLRLSGPQGTAVIAAGGGEGASASVALAALMEGEPARGLLAGMESLSVTNAEGHRQVLAVAWAGGVLTVDLVWPGERLALLDQLIESITPAPGPSR